MHPHVLLHRSTQAASHSLRQVWYGLIACFMSHDGTNQYSRLKDDSDEIRLCILDAGGKDDPLQFGLYVVSLSHAPTFEALSYTWAGSSTLNQVKKEASQRQMGQNVVSAMIHLRLPDKQRILWIDCLCINQSLHREKAHQVSMMGEIYGHALRVLIWLGEGDELSDIGMERISHYAVTQRARSNPSAAPPEFEISIDNKDSVALEAVLKREYFSRVWTIQEIVLAQSAIIVCGSKSVSWQDFVDTAVHLRHAPMERYATFRSQLRAIWNVTRVVPGGSLFTLLRNTFRSSHYHCGIDHDRVYALLSLAGDHERLDVDYDDPIRNVFIDVVRVYIENHKRLAILSYIQEPHCSPDLPSWVPDWRKDRITSSINIAETGEQSSRFCATLDSKPSVNYKTRGSFILTGYIVDSVSLVIATMPREVSDIDQADFNSWVKSFDLVRTVYAQTAEQIEVAYFKTLSTDQGPLSGRTDLDYVDTYYPLYRRWLAEGSDSRFSDRSTPLTLENLRNNRPRYKMPNLELPEEVRAEIWGEAANLYCRKRKLFHTAQGYMGLGPQLIRFNDKVCLLHGAAVPFIIRPTRKRGSYEVVGECYVHGIMDGEAYHAMDFSRVHRITLV
ncbi:heterokaryon incompatibility protein-domain-containing protein [Nemania diffusa]|nr:heterokaryon incompatibility protein-domain-containing protein [Nemania diffusa]